MNKQSAINLVKSTFENPYDKDRFLNFSRNLFHSFEPATFVYRGNYIPDAYKKQIKTLERIGKYEDRDKNKIDILAVCLNQDSTLERARTLQRNFISWYLNGSRGDIAKDAALVAFYVEGSKDWRLSLVKMEYRLGKSDSGRLKTFTELTPAKRFSFLVGEYENTHTAQKQLLPSLLNEEYPPSLSDLEKIFNVEVVTKEFFEKYKQLFLDTKEALDKIVKADPQIQSDFKDKNIDTVDFTKKLLGQIVFLYFLQKKGWFGVSRDDNWGTGPKEFLRLLFEKQVIDYKNYFNDILEPLFYEALAIERPDDFYSRFDCKIPFLNGGLFDPLNNYDWVHTDIHLPNHLFSNDNPTKEGDRGTGILDVFDRYNFTVKEDEPLEREVAVDPEMLGKVFENLLEVKDRKSKGTYYTPREIVHYMCQESLVNYLATELEGKTNKEDIETLVQIGESAVEHDTRVTEIGEETDTYSYKLPASVRENAKTIDEALANIRVCDPAVGSGAFLVGMMTEIIRVRNTISSYFVDGDRSIYTFKHHAIQNSLYGVDIDPGATEIAKLRLWLSLIVDEQDIKKIKPLPNLDYKIMQGNSLLEEFEGIKLFDEELFTKSAFDNTAQIEDLKTKLRGLEKEFIQLHYKNELKGSRKQQIEAELKKYNTLLNKLTKQPKPHVENTGLFDQESEAKAKAKELKRLQKEFFLTSHKKEKDQIKKRIESLTWEFIEATLREQGKESLMRQVEKFKKANIRPFFLWKLNYSDVFESKNGFDIVIANPPYVRQEEIVQYKDAIKNSYQVFSARSDLYTYFYEKGIDILRIGGFLTFISSNKFLRAKYGEKLRSYLKNNVQLLEIVDFGNLHKFEAITNTLILVLRKHRVSDNKFRYSKDIDAKEIVCNQYDLHDDSWTLADQTILDLKQNIADVGVPLADWDIKISYGIKAGFNEAFVIDKNTREKLIDRNKTSIELIKPLLRGRDIGRYLTKYSDKYIIISRYQGHEELENKFPEIVDHLSKYGTELKKRGQVRNGQHHWLELDNNPGKSYLSLFDQSKIIWIELSDKNKFTYTENGEYILAGAFMITGESLKYLLAFLNSKLCLFYFNLICNSSGMATTQWKKFVLDKMPVKRLGIPEQSPFSSLVDKILNITKDDDYSVNSEKQRTVKDLEKQIDKLFYDLYDLSPEEIAIVEGKQNETTENRDNN